MFNRTLQALLITFCVISAHAETGEHEFEDPFYVGLGLGMSFLQPETNSVALTLTEDSAIAYKLTGGYRFNDNWSIEAFWANLGEAEITATTGNILNVEYKTFGFAGLYNYPLSDRWSVFAKAGAGRLENNVRGVALERVEDFYIYAGAGVTWNIIGTWDLRAEYEYLDTDAQLLSFNIIKRFGSKNSRRIRRLETKVTEQDKLLATAYMAATAAEPKKDRGCEKYSIELHGVFFPRGSIELNEASTRALDSIVNKLRSLPPDIRFEVRAHTDNVGTEMYNYALSLSRARNVRDYMAQQGIPLSRIDAKGYGEWRPRDTNETQAGRYRNRRAELVLIGLEKYVEDIDSCPGIISKPIHQ